MVVLMVVLLVVTSNIVPMFLLGVDHPSRPTESRDGAGFVQWVVTL